MTNPRNELHSLDRASHMHSDRCNKKMKNIKNPRDRPEQSKNREKNAAFEPDGQNNYDDRQFSHVSTGITISYVFTIVNISLIGKNDYIGPQYRAPRKISFNRPVSPIFKNLNA